MIWTPKIEKAIMKASILHSAQTRKGDIPAPYITHLFSVLLIASAYTDDEDVLISAVLHDSIEDTEYTLEELEKDFGKRVKNIVLGVTLPREELGWKDERLAYIENLKNAPKESAIVSASDKIHNFYSTYTGFKKEHFMDVFKESIDLRIEIYSGIIDVIKSKIPENPIITKLEEVFEKYKNFIKKQI